MTHQRFLFAGLFTIALAATGCSVSSNDPPQSTTVVSPTEPPAPQTSTLIVDWTITGVKDPNECTKSQSSTIEISITNPDGTELAAYQQDCGAFSTSITLNPGTYSAFAVLLDQAGNTRTTDVPIRPFTLQGNDSLTIPIDFPSDSFR